MKYIYKSLSNYFYNRMMWLVRSENLGLSRRKMFGWLGLSVLVRVTEVFGISIFLPVFQFIKMEGNIDVLMQEYKFWIYLVDIFDFINLSISFILLLIISMSLFLLRQLTIFYQSIYTANIRVNIVKKIRDHLFNLYIRSNNKYYDNAAAGDIVNTISTEVISTQSAMIIPMILISYLITIIGYMVILFLISWEVTVISFFLLFLALQLPKIWFNKSMISGRKLASANAKLSNYLLQRIRSPRLVHLEGLESREIKDFSVFTRNQLENDLNRSLMQAKSDSIMEPAVVGVSLIFLYISYTYIHMDIEIIGLYLLVIMRLIPVFKGSVTYLHRLKGLQGSMENVEEKINKMKRMNELDHGNRDLLSIGDIFFNNVYYNYPDHSKNVINGVSFRFKKGTLNAIVGPSGSGKSTLIDLIPRLRLTSSGSIFINENPIKDYTLKSLREKISYAPQVPQLFGGSIIDHISYGNKDISLNEVVYAAKLAGADEFIKNLSGGYNASIKEDALNLSGGQRKRLDIARVLAKNSEVIIFDEPTSNLDAESEKKFIKMLNSIRKNKELIIIIITHRLSCAVESDRIIVLNNGVIEAEGEHNKLMEGDTWYKSAFESQSEKKTGKKQC